MELFFLCLLTLLALINMALAISTSLVLIKLYEFAKNEEERYQMEEEAKRQARNLIDVDRIGPAASSYAIRPR